MIVNQKYLYNIAKHIAPKTDIRSYLNGVLLEIDDTGRYYVATNGHMLVVIRDAREEDDINGEYLFPRDALVSLKPSKQTDKSFFEISADGIASLSVGNDMKMFKMLDGKFPTWRKVIPPRVTLELSQFNPEYLAKMTDCYKACFSDLKNTGLCLMHNGKGTALYQGNNPDWLGLVMPLRFDIDEAMMARFIDVKIGAEAAPLQAVA